MTTTVNQAPVTQTVAEIRQAQKAIRDHVGRLQERLKMIESGDAWNYAVFCTEHVNKDLPHGHWTSLKQTLQNDVQRLRAKLRMLDRQAAEARARAQAQAALGAKSQFEGRLEIALRQAEKNGELPESELAELRAAAEAVLLMFVNLVNTAPTEKNMELTLGMLEIPLVLGSDTDAGAAAVAFTALAGASEKLVERLDDAYRKNPTVRNYEKLLGGTATAQFLGGQLKPPPGFKPARTTHRIRPRDSLSAIAELYYGDQSLWYVIYLANLGIDPLKLPVGLLLKIP